MATTSMPPPRDPLTAPWDSPPCERSRVQDRRERRVTREQAVRRTQLRAELPPGHLPDKEPVSLAKRLSRAMAKDGMTAGDRKRRAERLAELQADIDAQSEAEDRAAREAQDAETKAVAAELEDLRAQVAALTAAKQREAEAKAAAEARAAQEASRAEAEARAAQEAARAEMEAKAAEEAARAEAVARPVPRRRQSSEQRRRLLPGSGSRSRLRSEPKLKLKAGPRLRPGPPPRPGPSRRREDRG